MTDEPSRSDEIKHVEGELKSLANQVGVAIGRLRALLGDEFVKKVHAAVTGRVAFDEAQPLTDADARAWSEANPGKQVRFTVESEVKPTGARKLDDWLDVKAPKGTVEIRSNEIKELEKQLKAIPGKLTVAELGWIHNRLGELYRMPVKGNAAQQSFAQAFGMAPSEIHTIEDAIVELADKLGEMRTDITSLRQTVGELQTPFEPYEPPVLAKILRPHLLALDDHGEDEWAEGSFGWGECLWVPGKVGIDVTEIKVEALAAGTDNIHGAQVKTYATYREDHHDTTQRELVECIAREAAKRNATVVYLSKPAHRHIHGDYPGDTPRFLQHWCYAAFLSAARAAGDEQ